MGWYASKEDVETIRKVVQSLADDNTKLIRRLAALEDRTRMYSSNQHRVPMYVEFHGHSMKSGSMDAPYEVDINTVVRQLVEASGLEVVVEDIKPARRVFLDRK